LRGGGRGAAWSCSRCRSRAGGRRRGDGYRSALFLTTARRLQSEKASNHQHAEEACQNVKFLFLILAYCRHMTPRPTTTVEKLLVERLSPAEMRAYLRVNHLQFFKHSQKRKVLNVKQSITLRA
jgi:hypothetical protein